MRIFCIIATILIYFLVVSMHPNIEKTVYAQPNLPLISLSGPIHINCGKVVEAGTSVCNRYGRLIGAYIDDTTPNIWHWAWLATKEFPHGLVLVARGMGQRGCPFKRYGSMILCLQEWYPVHSGYPLWEWGKFPKCNGYILQYKYRGFTGMGAPTATQERHLRAEAAQYHPRMILLY